MTPETDRVLDKRVTIPMMHGVGYLKMAASSAVAFYGRRYRLGAKSHDSIRVRTSRRLDSSHCGIWHEL